MQQGLLAIILVSLPVAAILWGRGTKWHRNNITIHVHSSYIILPYWLLCVLIALLLAFAFGGTEAYCHGFKKTGYNFIALGALLGIVGLLLYARGVFK